MSSKPTNAPPGGGFTARQYGKYLLVKKLAEGGMAEIFLAKQMGVEGFEKNVVIKRMLPHLSQVADFVTMFLDEARLAATLSHANVVQISDLGLADGCYYICMEYLPGEDFATVLRVARKRGEQAPLNIVTRVLAEAANGLHFAHEMTDASGKPLNIVHRDVSPSNIFITYTGQVKMLDFGIAKAESRVTNTTAGVVKGKYQYMAPEQANSAPVDRRADVYSLGVSMYEALTGVRPFARDTDLAILHAVLKHECRPIRELRPDLPQEVEQIVETAMSHRPEDRYQSAAEFSAAIERYMGATTSGAGGMALTNFMRGFFGEERMSEKTRIPTLREMAQVGSLGADILTPRLTPTQIEAVRTPVTNNADAETRAGVLPASQRKRRGAVAAALVGAVALAVGIPLGFNAWRNSRDGTTDLRVDAGAALVAQPVVDAGPPVEAPDAAVAAVLPVAEDAGAKEVDAGAAVAVPTKPIVLTPLVVQRVIAANKQKFTSCFRDHRADLPSATGTIKVTFAIASSGKVSSATTELEGTGVGKCVSGVVKAMRFPHHVDAEVRVPIALAYDVQ